MNRKFLLQVLIFTVLVLLSGCGSSTSAVSDSSLSVSETVEPVETIKGPDKTTIMIYMIGSDLESKGGAATEDITEISNSGVDLNHVNILLYTGGSIDWYSDINVSSDENCLFYLTENGFVKVSSSPDMSMGNPENLTNFLNYAYTNYTADSYDLILWNHGNGPVMGYGLDKVHDNDSLTLSEIRTALEASPFGPDNKLNFIGFDACLMSSAELAVIVSDYADYLIASQETEPSFGWNYNFLPQVTNVEESALPAVIIDTYIDYCVKFNEENPFFSSDVTLAVMDLSKAGELNEAIENLFSKASSDISGDFNNLARDRISSRDVGRASTGSDYDLVDLTDLAENMQAHFPTEVEALQKVLSEMIVYNRTNTVRCSGLSIYYPFYNKNYYDYKWRSDYSELGVFPSYVNYLSKYELVWLAAPRENYSGEALTPEQVGDQTFTLQLTDEQAENYASGRYFILARDGENRYRPIYIGSSVEIDGNTLYAEFDGKVIYFVDDFNRGGIPFLSELDTVDDVTYYSLSAYLTGGDAFDRAYFRNAVNVEITLSANQETEEVEIVSVYAVDDEQSDISTGKRKQINYKDWDWMKLILAGRRYLTRDEAGNILPVGKWENDSWLTWYECAYNVNGFQFKYLPIQETGEEYFLCFDVMDLQGNRYGSELMPIAIAGDTDVTGQKEPTMVSFDAESKVCFFERKNVSAYAIVNKDIKTGESLFNFYVNNDNSDSVTAYFRNIVVDGQYVLPNYEYIYAYGNRSAFDEFGELKDMCRELGIEFPHEIYFELDIENDITGETICWQEPFSIKIPESMSVDISMVPIGGFSVSDVVLADNDEVKVTLLAAGALWEYNQDNKLTIICEVENKTDEVIEYCYFWNVGGYDIENYGTVKIAPGYKVYTKENIALTTTAFLDAPEIPKTVTGLTYNYRVGDMLSFIAEGNNDNFTTVNVTGSNNEISIKTSDRFLDGAYAVNVPKEGIELYNDGAIRVALRVNYSDYLNYKTWISFENTGSERTKVSLAYLRANGKYQLDESEYTYMDPGTMKYFNVDNLPLIMMMNDEKLEEIKCLISLNDKEYQNITVNVSDNGKTKTDYYYEPYLGAITEDKVIKDEDGVKLTIRHLGTTLRSSSGDGASLEVIWELENTSDITKEIYIEGYSINGVFFHSYGSCILYPGQKTIFTDIKTKSCFEEAGITGIRDISVLVAIKPATGNLTEAEKHGEEWVSIPLDNSSSAAYNVAKGRLLWKSNNISIYAIDSQKSEEETANDLEWRQKILIVNDSDINYYLHVRDVKMDGEDVYDTSLLLLGSGASGRVGAHTMAFGELMVSVDRGETLPEKAEFKFQFSSLDETTNYPTAESALTFNLR